MTNETKESDIIILDPADYERDPINRADVVQFADTLMGIHPEAASIGVVGMRVVAQLAIATGANPLPGTNGIHAWTDNKGNRCIQLGIGYWRQQAEMAGGILWISRPRPMTDEERKDYQVTEHQQSSICIGALSRDVFSLLKNAKECGFDLSLEDAKNEVARVGTGVVNPGEYAKNGRSPQWTADLRSERDLLRQLVPAMSMNASERPKILDETPAQIVVGAQNREAWELLIDQTDLPDGYGIDDANSDFFGDEVEPEFEDAHVEGEIFESETTTPEMMGADIPTVDNLTREPEPIKNDNGNLPPSHLIADLRATIEGAGDSVELGFVNHRLVDTGLYNAAPHAFNAVKLWEGWPAEGKYSVAELNGGSKITVEKALTIFDWAVDRKLEVEEAK